MTGHKTPPEKQLDWLYQSFDDLDKRHLYAAIALRQHTFVVEQNLNYQDADWEDPYAMHILGLDNGDLAAYARIFLPTGKSGAARIGRIVTAPAYRGHGYGDKLMHKALELIEEEVGKVPVVMSAQTHMEKFYSRFGFERVGDEYLEAGIPHVRVRRDA